MRDATRRLLRTLESMRLGIGLLVVIIALCFVGSIIPQGQTAEYYQAAYGDNGRLIQIIGLDKMFSQWYFVAIFGLLCLNLTFCSILRLRNIGARERALLSRAREDEVNFTANPEEVKTVTRGKTGAFIKGRWGLYGSFVTHVGLLLLLIAGGCTMALETNYDNFILVGESVTLPDQTTIRVNDFNLVDDEGKTEYISDITLSAPGADKLDARVLVNHPARFGEWTVYQQDYAYAAMVNVKNGPHDPGQDVPVDAGAFLTLDGEHGVGFYAMYPDYAEDESGQIAPMSAAKGDMPNPIYLVRVIDGNGPRMLMAKMNSSLEVDGVTYTFLPPMAYPGLRAKHLPGWALPVLYLSFVLLLVGLYLCFFVTPCAVCAREDGLCVVGAKDTEGAIEALKDKFGRD